MEKLFYTTPRSLWGELLITSSSLGVSGLHFLDCEDPREALEKMRLRSGAAETVESSRCSMGSSKNWLPTTAGSWFRFRFRWT